ncbi:MAG: PEPxxWA-CTERM sorting domain-containing protein [Caulobacterales bacterium]|nr:PEPxxWA-CTERM sorting domain-containing protein [Caulobacterales bacterium]
MKLRTSILAGGLALLLAGPALADITVLPGTAPGALDPVTLDAGPLDFFIDGTVGPSNTALTFTGAENLSVQGQKIVAATGTFNFLLFSLVNPTLTFTGAEFNLNAAANGTTSIFAYDQFGNGFGGVYALKAAGNNFFNVAAANGQHIQSIVVMSSAALDDIAQIRLGGVQALVPEPATWAMMILGFGGVGGLVRLRRRVQALA